MFYAWLFSVGRIGGAGTIVGRKLGARIVGVGIASSVSARWHLGIGMTHWTTSLMIKAQSVLRGILLDQGISRVVT